MAYRKKAMKKRAPKRKAYKRKGSKLLKKMIRREISRDVENKMVQSFNLGKDLDTPATASWELTNIIPLGPGTGGVLINQGVGQADRVGNTIRTKKLTFKGSLIANPYNATSFPTPLPVQVKMWIFYDKANPTTFPSPTADFFQNGSSSRGFLSDLVDFWAPVNLDRYRVLTTRTFKLGYSSYQGSGSAAALQFMANNDFKLNVNFSVDLTKYYPKVVKFNDNTSVPSSRNLYAMFEYASAAGGQFGSGIKAVNLSYMQQYVYEDA